MNKNGKIYPFLGLRGDAKILYNDLKTDPSPHVEFMCIGESDQNLFK